MEEIPNNHLGYRKKPVNNGIFTISTGELIRISEASKRIIAGSHRNAAMLVRLHVGTPKVTQTDDNASSWWFENLPNPFEKDWTKWIISPNRDEQFLKYIYIYMCV